MINYGTKPYYKYLPENTRRMLDMLSPTDNTQFKSNSDAIAKEIARQQFVQNYQPQTSFWNKIVSDIKTFGASFPKIPSILWDTMKNDLAATGNYDTSKPFWRQGEGYNVFTNQESRDLYKKNIGSQALTGLVPGFKFLETIAHAPYVENTKFGKAIPKTPISSFVNSAILNSLMKNTGKWIYNPEAEAGDGFKAHRKKIHDGQNSKNIHF